MKIGDKVKFIGFDVDGTLTKGYSWYRLHKAMGMADDEEQEVVLQIKSERLDPFEIGKMVTRYYRRYEQNNKEHMMKVLSKWEFEDGVEDVVNRLKNKYKLGIVSGGPHLFVRSVAERLGIAIWRSTNYILFDKDGSRFVKIWVEGGPEMKAIYLKEIGRSLGIKADEMMFVGDSLSDEAAFEYAAYPVLYVHHDNRMNTRDTIAKLRQKTRFAITKFSELFDVLEFST
ncbi:MAG: HAD-IB family phosphatase [bacterium]|nr:HAD-IB family phosphatase [bacterium]